MRAIRGADLQLSVRAAAQRPDDRPFASLLEKRGRLLLTRLPRLPLVFLSDGWSRADSSSGFGSATANVIIACCLLVLSGLFSGLTLGLMSLDLVSLEILAEGGDDEEREYAKNHPVRGGVTSSCALLLGNTMVNALVAILMADLTDGIVGLLLSTFSIVVFGEIIHKGGVLSPRLVHRRQHRLAGENLHRAPVRGRVAISMLLDRVLERDIEQVFSSGRAAQAHPHPRGEP